MTDEEKLARLAQAGLRVKPLEWRQQYEDHKLSSKVGGYRLRMARVKEPGKHFWWVEYYDRMLDTPLLCFGQAKLAAAQDHQRRVLECLEEVLTPAGEEAQP